MSSTASPPDPPAGWLACTARPHEGFEDHTSLASIRAAGISVQRYSARLADLNAAVAAHAKVLRQAEGYMRGLRAGLVILDEQIELLGDARLLPGDARLVYTAEGAPSLTASYRTAGPFPIPPSTVVEAARDRLLHHVAAARADKCEDCRAGNCAACGNCGCCKRAKS